MIEKKFFDDDSVPIRILEKYDKQTLIDKKGKHLVPWKKYEFS